MQNELTVTTGGQLPAVQQQALVPLAAILQAAQDPNTDLAKMEGLIALYERMQDREAKAEFNRSMIAAQAAMPRVDRADRVINHKTNQVQSRYATLERIDKIVRDIIQGFGFSFSCAIESVEANKYIVAATVRHSAGHVEVYRIPLALDQSGAKNDTQGMGSTLSYGRRYLLCSIFNIITEGKDNDGRGPAATITAEQALSVEDCLTTLAVDRKKFFIHVFGLEADGKTVADIPAARYGDVMRLFEQKRRAGA